MRNSKVFYVSFILIGYIHSTLYAGTTSVWDKFVNFFNPSSVEGEGAAYDEIRKLDEEIRNTKNDYNREHRPQRKSMLRKHLDELSAKRDSLMLVTNYQKPSKNSMTKTTPPENKNSRHDTVWVTVRDTIRIQDTIFLQDPRFACPPAK